jgi:hypothetical protein
MVYMNGKNTLEAAALDDFESMAKVGSTDSVNLVVELGRPEKHPYDTGDGDWRGVMRFRVTKGISPLPANAINPNDVTVLHSNMGDAATLAAFVDWAESLYPAKKYMLLIWSHGQGWRIQLSRSRLRTSRNLYLKLAAFDESARVNAVPDDLRGGFRSVSIDEDYGRPMYNRDIEDKLQGRHFEIIGFDACLMGMIETGYALRNVATLMVATEELSPDAGWKYADWMNEVIKKPNLDAMALAKILVSSYKAAYSGSSVDTSSLMSLDLSKIEAFGGSLSQFAQTLQHALPSEANSIASARHLSQTLGDWSSQSWFSCSSQDVLRFHGVDLGQFLTIYGQTTQNAQIKQQAAQLLMSARILTTAAFVSSPSGDDYSNNYVGVSIYFPGSPLDFKCDPDRDGYDVQKVRSGNVVFPPEFVQKEKWADFLHDYLSVARDDQHDQ